MRDKVETRGEDGEWTDWMKDVEDAGKTIERDVRWGRCHRKRSKGLWEMEADDLIRQQPKEKEEEAKIWGPFHFP